MLGFLRLVAALSVCIAVAACAPMASTRAPTPTDQPARLDEEIDRQIEQVQARLRNDPRDVNALDLLAGLYLQKARETADPSIYGKAEQALTLALRQRPADVTALASMGSLALSRHQFDAALKWGERAHTADPHSARALGVIVDAQVELGRDDEAAETTQRMVDLRPDLSSYSRVAYLRELHGDVPGAIEAMRLAIAAGGPAPENVAYLEVLLGNLYFDSGRLDEAESQYRATAARYSGYVHALAGVARAQAARGNHDAAIALYQQVVDRFPLPEYAIALGDVCTLAGREEQARRSYELVEAQARLYEASGVNVDAEMALFRADHGRDLPGAVAAARRASDTRPSVVTADVLAWTLYRAGDLTSALAAARQAHRLGTQNALFFFHSGMIEAGLGMKEKARQDLRQALSINPYFSLLWAGQARKTLAALEAPA